MRLVRRVAPPNQRRCSILWARRPYNARICTVTGKIRSFAVQYGVPFFVWYFIVEYGSWAALTACLHYRWLSVDAVSLLHCMGLPRNSTKQTSWSCGPVRISGRFIANLSAAGAVTTAIIPAVVPFCVVTLPLFRRAAMPAIRFWSRLHV